MSTPALALAAGMLTVAAPCVLPLLPVVLGASVGQRQGTRPLFIAAGFAAAFSIAAMVFASLPQVLGLTQQALRDVAAGMLLLFGALMLWPAPFHALTLRMGPTLAPFHRLADRAGPGNLGGLLLGLSLGALWTPCAGPVLASILTLVAAETDPARAALLLVSYAVGAAVPMLVIAYGGQWVSAHVRQFARHARRLQQWFGAVVMAVAVTMFLQLDGLVTVWLTGLFP